ncbi:MAG TPA: hypothetical protein PK129_09310 [Cellvibrionaceae bacterium]|nr:hypothetical protein [Cellvibrionaceae bacterium]
MANFSEHRKWITCREVLEYLDITHTDLLHIVEQYLLAPYLDVRNLNCVCLPIVPLENHNEFLIDHVLGKCSTEFECFKAANNDSNYLKLDISLSCPKGIINASLTGRYEPHLFFEESKRVIPLHVHGLTAVDTNVFGNESYFLFNLYDFLFPKEEVF